MRNEGKLSASDRPSRPAPGGRVVSIHLAPVGAARMLSVTEVRAVAGRGLDGDRYFLGTGTWSHNGTGGKQVTLIEAEAVEAIERDYDVEIDPAEARRNIVTRGMPLNHLVGREFTIGEVRLRGVRLCEPCAHLVKMTGQLQVLPSLVHRGGLRADLLTNGVIRVGDPVELSDERPG